MIEPTLEEVGQILDRLEIEIKSAPRRAFRDDRIPAENGAAASILRQKAKDKANAEITALFRSTIHSEFLEVTEHFIKQGYIKPLALPVIHAMRREAQQ